MCMYVCVCVCVCVRACVCVCVCVCNPSFITLNAGRFGAGLTLQAKVRMLSVEGFEARSANKPSSNGRNSRSLTRTPDPPGTKYTHSLGKEVTLDDPYDTTALHIFIRENFQNALLVEEHQVSGGYNSSVIVGGRLPPTPLLCVCGKV